MESAPVAALLLLTATVLAFALRRQRQQTGQSGTGLITVLFFFSGFPALIYQIVWQRALFVIYGVNVQSVAVVVSAFMLGLGLGSLAGGRLSAAFPRHGIVIFGICELGVAIFGLGSLRVFHWAAEYTAGANLGLTILFSFLLLIVPTMLMGATLPLLVEQLVRSSGDVGRSVAILYFANTLGSAFACYLCAEYVLLNFGQSGSVTLAACLNLVVGTVAYWYGRRESSRPVESNPLTKTAISTAQRGLPLGVAMSIAGLAGFIALGFEIEWFRVLALGSADRAPAFALLLSTYLSGIAAGSYATEKLTDGKSPVAVANTIGMMLLSAGAFSVYLPPLVAQLSWKNYALMASAPAFFVTAGLLGSVFPLLCRVAVSADTDSGRHVSLIYLANILGAALGSLVVGFILMDDFGLKQIAIQLGLLAGLAGTLVLLFSPGRLRTPSLGKLCAVAVALAAILFSSPLYFNLFGRLIFGRKAAMVGHMAHVVENRNGVIAVTADGRVMGEGVHDGYFNVDPLHDKNMIFRAYALGLFDAMPRKTLLIGLSSGSWAQVAINQPHIESMDIVEINPGYLRLIAGYPMVSSLLTNPKVHISIDDGRRWLLAHPEARYDLVLMNTSFFWRDHSSNLLSSDFLRLVKMHLNPGGVLYYNATASAEVMATALHVFRYGIRVMNFLAVSDSPFAVDKERWLQELREYRIDGRLMFDPQNPKTKEILTAYAALADSRLGRSQGADIEDGDALAVRIGKRRIITDDNMGEEWANVNGADWR
jgi:predicted membrane-bound spermidine synthase